MGRELALDLRPWRNASKIQQASTETSQARAALRLSGSPPWEVIPDARPTLDAVAIPGSVADATELAALIPVLDAAARLRAYGRGIAEAAPDLHPAFTALPQEKTLTDLLRRSIDPDGRVRDEASPALRRARQRIRDLRAEIVKTLEGYFRTATADSTFQERYVTVRHGRYVLPVRIEAKARVRGIVHDRSQSGATLFVEPEGVVDANNDLVQATREEESEVLRVLAALTDAVRVALPELTALVTGIGLLDLIFARALLAERMNAVEPVLADERTVELLDARNPLLLGQSWNEPGRAVVAVDIHLDAKRPLLVITGPNAGGKTVTLKTMVLCALMAQAGLHVPAREGARLPVFSQIFAIVGDDQSVAENLSTFSAFVKQLRVVMDDVDEHSLVVLDELGAGTDPDDGAALAQATLEELARRGALTIASTHLEPLKGFASSHPAARNASVEFDAERLTPTFRLVYDRPGQSYALAIGARLGLSPALIERAHSYRSAQQRQLQELIARLDDRDRRDAERAALIERREAESAGLLARAEAELAAAEKSAREIVARAQADSQKKVAEIRRAVNQEWEQLRGGEKSRAELSQRLKRVRDVAHRARTMGVEPSSSAAELSRRAAAVGDQVEVAHLGLKGEILAIDGSTATVRAGTLTVKVPAQALRVTAAEAVAVAARATPARIQTPERTTVSGELHLIGRTRDEARDLLEKYLDDAFLAGLGSVRIIHGKGTGALRKAVEDVLSVHPLVTEHHGGALQQGGAGATVAVLGQS